MLRPLFLLLLLVFSLSVRAAYFPLQSQCDGLKQLPVGTMTGSCLGLLADNSMEINFRKPRKALELKGTAQILVTDMGGWSPYRGILWLLSFESTNYSKLLSAKPLLERLNLPHDIKLGNDGFIYLGEAHQIQRFKLSKSHITEQQTIINDLPFTAEGYRHPLTNFVFLKNNDLLINVGSASDNCDLSSKKSECKEASWVGLRRYHYNKATNLWSPEFDQFATGLRNSIALTVHDSGTILQAENSSDLKDADEPYEEINIVKEGGFYGWPYCLNRRFNPEFREDGCSHPNYQEPWSLMPPHTAPLDMIYYNSDYFPALKGQLLISWHGYRVVGNRLVSYKVDEQGLPLLTEKPTFNRDPIPPATQFTQHEFNPKGGSSSDAQHQEVISHWNHVKGLRPEGAPVGLLQLSDGSLLIVDDKNKALLRLAKGEAYKSRSEKHEVRKISGFNYSGQSKELLLQQCSACHTELVSAPGVLLNPENGWLRKENGITVLERQLTFGVMPPTGKLKEEGISIILKAVK